MLREGPPLGIHTLIWCDSVNNLNRTFDRQGTKEFENRIMFQMSANDSSTLIDSPAAGKLGENRALYFSEEENRIEKFRPYGVPEMDWLEDVQETVRGPPAARGRMVELNRQRPRSNGAETEPVGNGRPLTSSRTRPAPFSTSLSIRPSRPSEPARPAPAASADHEQRGRSVASRFNCA